MKEHVTRYEIITWDWKNSPPWQRINDLIADGGRFIQEVSTGDDSNAIVISTIKIMPVQAQIFYNQEFGLSDDFGSTANEKSF